MPKTHRVLGQPTAIDRSRSDYQRRGTRQQQGYTNEWLRAAADYRRRHPLCKMCMDRGRITPCQCVDHVIPHRGDPVLFWDEDNWQSLCNPCHNGPKRRIEERMRRDERKLSAPPRPVGTRGDVNCRPRVVEARLVANFCTRELKTGGISRNSRREGL
jgi:5-methylcytosine-specific restriction endonuclease McrA